MTEDAADVDDCGFLGGRLTLRQFRRGHRAGTDAVLLAAAAAAKPGEHLLDAGAGSGAVALAVLAKMPDLTATLVERDPATAELAAFNLAHNGFSGRACVLQADIFDKDACQAVWRDGADVVVSNPPFFEANQVRASSNRHRRTSHVLDRPIVDWPRRLLACLRPKGRLVLIHRPEALPRLLSILDGRLGAILVRPVYGLADRPAIRLLISGAAGSRAPLAFAPPLVLHDPSGAFTPAAQRLHAGEDVLI